MKTDLEPLRVAINADRPRLCNALGLPFDAREERHECPNCHESNKRATLSTEAGFKCHRCGWTGDGFNLIECVKKCTFPDAVKVASDIYSASATTATRSPTASRKGKGGKTIHPTREKAVEALKWAMNKNGGKWELTRSDTYHDRSGKEVAGVLRFDDHAAGQKTYRPIRAVAGGWQIGDPAGKWPLLNLHEISTAEKSKTVFIAEGEKACEAGSVIGLLCTTSAHGAKSPQKTDWSPLEGRNVVILPDNDEAGRAYAVDVARRCREAGALSVKEVILPNLPEGGDLYEFKNAGGTAKDVFNLAEQSETMTESEPDNAEPDGATVETLRSGLWDLTQEQKLKIISANEFNRKGASAVVEWLHRRGRFYFNIQHRHFSNVLFFDNERKLLHSVQSDAFLAWVAECMGINRSEQLFKFTATALETEGLSERSQGIEPASFWAARRDGEQIKAIYISNGAGEMVRITAGKVELVDNGTDNVLFPAGAVLNPWQLTEGRDPFNACTIFNSMSTTAAHGQDLLKLWTMALFADFSSKPPLCVTSPVGGGKTALVRAVFRLLGIPESINAITKGGEDDFWIIEDAGGLACFDNADTRIVWFPDALAAAATAGSYQTRKLYTNSESIILRSRAAIAITSANPSFASDAGLADRLLVIRLQRRKGETAESSLFSEVTETRNAGLSWIAEALSKAIADTETTPSGLNSRHPDFASFAVKIGRAIGHEAEAVNALRAAEADKSLFNIENDNLGAALLELLQNGDFAGTAAELLNEIKIIDSSLDGKLSTRGLGKRLSKLWPHLEATFNAKKEKGRGGYIQYSFKTVENGEFGEFKHPIIKKSPVRESIESIRLRPFQTHQTHQLDQTTENHSEQLNLVLNTATNENERLITSTEYLSMFSYDDEDPDDIPPP